MKKVMLLVGLCSCLVNVAAAEPGDVLAKDFRTMMEWFPGVYDNQEQVYFEEEQNIAEELRHERIHHVFKKVDLPEFGDNVFYVQQHQNDDPADIYRQRIYVFDTDSEENAIRLVIHTPNNVEALIDAHLDVSKLKNLTPDNTSTTAGCEVFWKRQANQFHGYMRPGACTFLSKRSGKRIVISDDLVLTESEIWINDQAVDEDGGYIFGNKAGIPHKNRKARRFECWAAVLRKDGEWTFYSDLEIWDQGGMVWLETDEESPQKVGIKLRNVVWPYGRNKPSLVIYAYREDEARAVSYAWAEPTAERIGINLRWVQGSCSLSR